MLNRPNARESQSDRKHNVEVRAVRPSFVTLLYGPLHGRRYSTNGCTSRLTICVGLNESGQQVYHEYLWMGGLRARYLGTYYLND